MRDTDFLRRGVRIIEVVVKTAMKNSNFSQLGVCHDCGPSGRADDAMMIIRKAILEHENQKLEISLCNHIITYVDALLTATSANPKMSKPEIMMGPRESEYPTVIPFFRQLFRW